jgi:DNA repair exonuclease SbcCD nuclease subunit
MITLLWRTDLHISDKAPRSRTDDWRGTLLGKLRQVGALAKKHKADAVLDGGDIFDTKSPFRNSHEMVRAIADVQAKYPCPTFSCVGNHDCVYGDYSFIDRQPLGVLFSTGVFQRLYDNHEAVFIDHKGVKVRVVGVPYHGAEYDMDRIWGIQKKDENYLVVVAHLLASRAGGTMFQGEDIIKYGDLKDHPASIFAFGHWHKDQGVYEYAPGKFAVNVGSLSRGALIEDNVERSPSIARLRFTKESCEIDQIPLEVAPATEVFDIEARVRTESRTSMMDSFIDRIQEALSTQDKASLIEIIRGMPEIPEVVREKAYLYLEKTA